MSRLGSIDNGKGVYLLGVCFLGGIHPDYSKDLLVIPASTRPAERALSLGADACDSAAEEPRRQSAN